MTLHHHVSLGMDDTPIPIPLPGYLARKLSDTLIKVRNGSQPILHEEGGCALSAEECSLLFNYAIRLDVLRAHNFL